MAKSLHQALARHLKELRALPREQLVDLRYEKFRKMSRFVE
jgi:acetyl-CoA carboxylase carboxyl transferase subunit alpha